jgi:hypothetical protein
VPIILANNPEKDVMLTSNSGGNFTIQSPVNQAISSSEIYPSQNREPQ